MQQDNFSAGKTAHIPQQSFKPYQRKSQGLLHVQTHKNEFSKRPNPYLLDESRVLEPQLHKNLKAENKFIPLLLQNSSPNYYTKQQALVYANELMAAQLQREYYQHCLANQVQNLNLQLALYQAAVDQSRSTISHVKKLESPSKVILIDDDAHSDSAETNITEGFYCSPKIHITQAEEELIFEEPAFIEEEEAQSTEALPLQTEITPILLKKESSLKDQKAVIPKLSLNRKNDQRKRNVRLLWNPETLDRVKFESFMEELSKILRRRISNEQTVIAILQCFDMDTEKALSTIKRNKADYQNLFSISLRNTRRTIN